MNRTNLLGIIALVVIAVLVIVGLRYAPPSGSVSSGESQAVSSVVQNFGSALQKVSLMAPDAATQIAAQYGPYATPELIAQWQHDPSKVPGRTTSSPWPQQINIVSVTKMNGTTYQVEGTVVEVANGSSGPTPAATYPVSMQVVKRAGQWLIASYSAGAYSELPQEVTVTGTWECLPPKDPNGPHMLECAFGIAKDESDGHLAVDTSHMKTPSINVPTGTRVRIVGTLTPANQLNSIQKYDIDGIIQATSIQEIPN